MIASAKKLNIKIIKELRIKNKITQSDMAKLLNLSNTAAYSRRENGEYKFKTNELPILAYAFKTKIEKFFS